MFACLSYCLSMSAKCIGHGGARVQREVSGWPDVDLGQLRGCLDQDSTGSLCSRGERRCKGPEVGGPLVSRRGGRK